MFAIEVPNISPEAKLGPFVVSDAIATVDDTSPSAANASDGNWKRSEHVANNKMNN